MSCVIDKKYYGRQVYRFYMNSDEFVLSNVIW